mmetsp:Transcript_36268/g.67343  ORF Transcript_36268/g.67343 Transcript_36268/m.67343 type:complete len:628 (+) Transcript_36268:163-2046(+)
METMKLSTRPRYKYTSHEHTMDRKPFGENNEDDDIYHGSETPPSMPVMHEDYYAHQPEHASSSADGRNWIQHQHPPYLHNQQQHQQHQHQHEPHQPPQFGTPFYPQINGGGPVYPNQMAHHHHHHAAYYHSPIMHAPPPMVPGGHNMGPPPPVYPGQSPPQQSGLIPHVSSPTPSPVMYQALDSRGSLSSYSSTDTLSLSSSTRRGRHGRRQRRSGNNNNLRQQQQQQQHQHSTGTSSASSSSSAAIAGTNTGNSGSPPNRGWYRYDDNTTLYQMRGRIVEIAKDRDGSKFIQRRLQVANFAEMDIAFEEAVDDMEELWNDVYGNYILQGLLELGTDEMRDRIAEKIVDSGVVSLSTKVYGCRLIQKALDTLNKEDVANIVASVKGKVWLLVHDHNGNHVIQKSVTKINEFFHQSQGQEDTAEYERLLASLDIIIGEVTNNIKDLSVHPYGCRVVQRLIENCAGEQKAQVLDSISQGDLFEVLINHEYGNYVVQRILAYGRVSDRSAIFDAITTNILKLSKQKHSSNVVEMMLTYGDAGQRHAIIEEIINCYCVDQNFVNKSAAVSMSEDAYANYVMKTVLDILEEGPTRERLFDMLLSSLAELEKSPFAKQVVLRVKAYSQESAYG